LNPPRKAVIRGLEPKFYFRLNLLNLLRCNRQRSATRGSASLFLEYRDCQLIKRREAVSLGPEANSARSLDRPITRDLKIEQIAVSDLVPYVRNPRTHSEAQVAVIAASIERFGWTNPVLIGNDNDIIAGHGRVLAAKRLGIKTVPTLRIGDLSLPWPAITSRSERSPQ
jgi:hypothetical protein